MRVLLLMVAMFTASSAVAQEDWRGRCDEIDQRVAGTLPATTQALENLRELLPADLEHLAENEGTSAAVASLRGVFDNSTVLTVADARKMIELFSAAIEALPALERLEAAATDFDTSC